MTEIKEGGCQGGMAPGELFPGIGFIVTNLQRKSENIIRFYNGLGNCKQWTKEGKYALNWTR